MLRRFAFRGIILLVLSTSPFALFAVLFPPPAQAQSFNCRYARTADEVLICRDPQLAKLDEQMAAIFFSVRDSLPGPQQALLDSQQQSWLASREACGGDAACIAAAYIQRIARLTALQTGSPKQASNTSYWFVANTRAPDAYLALRNAPSSQYGERIAIMPNGTLLQVLQQRPDRWWFVRVFQTGLQGWALSGQGDRIWIECCQNAGGSQIAPPRAATTEQTSPEESSGTGFFVAPHLVLTNNHVIKECGQYPITVSYPDRRPERAFISGEDDTNDLVLLQTDLPNRSIASFRFGPRVGEQVAAYGFPLLGLLSPSGNFTLGNVTSLAGINDDTRVLQTSTPVQPGNSGGPLMDMSGSVVGVIESQLNALAMIKATSDIPQNINFAIQSPIVINFLGVKGVSPSLAGSNLKALNPADVATVAEGFTVQVVCQPMTTGH